MSGLITSVNNTLNTTGRTVEELAKIGENTGKFANVLITGTTENVDAATKLSAAGMTVTKDNLIAVSSLSVAGMEATKENIKAASNLSVAGIDTAKLTLEESKKYITAASDLTKSGIDFTTSGVEVAKKQLEAASELSEKGIKITTENLESASKLLNTTTNIANTTLGTLGKMTDTSLKVASSLTGAISSMITGSVDAVGNKIKQKQNAYAAANAAQQKQLEGLNNTDETAKQKVLDKLKNDKINDFNNIVTGINTDIDQLQKTISFSLDQVQKIIQEQLKCKIGSLGIFEKKCTDEEVKEIYDFEAKVRPVKKQMLGDFLKLNHEILSKPTLFKSELNKIINSVNDTNKSNLHHDIQKLITSLTDTIPGDLTNLSNKYNKKIADLTDSIFEDKMYEPLISTTPVVSKIDTASNDLKGDNKVSDIKANTYLDNSIMNNPAAMAAGRKQTRRKNRRTKKTSRRHKKRTYKRVHF
jgi:hypothetical protein